MKELERSSFRKLSRRWYLGCCLLDAMKYGRWENVRVLTRDTEIDPNVLVPEYGIAPMHCAAGIAPEEFGVKCIKEFIKVGGDPNVCCSEGVTPVHVSACWGHVKVLNVLLSNGGNPHLVDDEGKNAFDYAQGIEGVSQMLEQFENVQQKLSNDLEIKALRHPKQDLNTTGITEDNEEDLDLNASAISLIFKHRQGVLLFESLPEDDSGSSTTLDTTFTEDFTFEPNEKISPKSSFAVTDGKNYSLISTDDEICNENILSSDISNVIKVINESVEKSNNSRGDNEVPTNENIIFYENYDINAKDLEKSKYELAATSLYQNEEYNQTASELAEVLTLSTNIIDPINVDKNKSETRENYSMFPHKRSKSKLNTSIKSLVEESCYNAALESNEMRESERSSSLESVVSSSSHFRLPKRVREKLLYFKVNTHYSTRVCKIISKSCDNVRSRKNLYSSGYEFWSTRVKSNSYPCYTMPRRNINKIN